MGRAARLSPVVQQVKVSAAVLAGLDPCQPGAPGERAHSAGVRKLSTWWLVELGGDRG